MGRINTCSFCGLNQNQVKRLISGPAIYICDRCIGNMSAQLEGREPDQEIKLREEIERAVTESFRRVMATLNLGPLHEKYQRLVKVKFKEGPDSPTFPEVFAEFKRGVEEEIPAGDYRTRYDLGIAYSEMGLKEDAFRELMQSLGYALANQDFERAAEIMSALLVVQLDAARVIQSIREVFSRMPE